MRKLSGQKGRKGSSKCTVVHLTTIKTTAWRNLSTTAQALYPILKLEWKGANFNNNGQLCLSSRSACDMMGISKAETVTRAFKDLQAKGFVKVHQGAILGSSGDAKSFLFELTELALPGKSPSKDFEKWSEGNDFPVVHAPANNPTGKGFKKITHPNKRDDPILKKAMKTSAPSQKTGRPILKNGTIHHA